jgi:RND family efflux transporter MFP subunit
MAALRALVMRKLGMNKGINTRHVLIVIAILLIAAAVAVLIIKTAPKPQRASEEKVARLVETIALERSSEGPQWMGGGEVSAAQRVTLSPQVSGRIEYVDADAVPGTRLQKGQLLARIEPQEYQLQVQQSKAAVIQAQATLDLEKGQASIAKQEYQLAVSQMNNTQAIDNALVLRKPQVAAAEAGLKTARAKLELMELNLKRTQIKMPFNGQIIARSTSIGSQVSPNTMLFDVVATDEFWVQVKVSQQFLPLLDTTQPVIIKQGPYQREATVLQTLVDVDAKDRQAKILISVKNPLARNSAADDVTSLGTLDRILDRVLLGSYVECILFAKPIENTFVIENRYIKEGGFIWVVNDNKLYKRQLEMVYQGRFKSWATDGIVEGDELLISNLGVVTEGTPVRLATSQAPLNSKAK